MATGRAGAGAGLAGEPALGSAPPAWHSQASQPGEPYSLMEPGQGRAGGGGVLAALLRSAPPAWQGQPPLMETGRACNILFSRILFSIFCFQQHLLPLFSKFQFDVVTRFQYLVVSLLF